MIVTTAEATVEEAREADLLAAWAEVTAGPLPEGLVESTLVQSEGGKWRIHTVWESRGAIEKMRATTDTPAAIAMFAAAGASPTVAAWDVVGHVRRP